MKSRRGFASMDPEKRRAIAQKGGRSAQAKGTAHQWTSEEAKLAGQKGGRVASEKRLQAKADLEPKELQYDGDRDEYYGGSDGGK